MVQIPTMTGKVSLDGGKSILDFVNGTTRYIMVDAETIIDKRNRILKTIHDYSHSNSVIEGTTWNTRTPDAGRDLLKNILESLKLTSVEELENLVRVRSALLLARSIIEGTFRCNNPQILDDLIPEAMNILQKYFDYSLDSFSQELMQSFLTQYSQESVAYLLDILPIGGDMALLTSICNNTFTNSSYMYENRKQILRTLRDTLNLLMQDELPYAYLVHRGRVDDLMADMGFEDTKSLMEHVEETLKASKQFKDEF
jgi:hypothetical protein